MKTNSPMNFHRLKWSTVSITMALFIIIVYATIGLYTLIDVTTLISMQSLERTNETILLMTEFSTVTINFRWISVFVYFSIALFAILLLCGIQLSQPWLLFAWAISMVIMLLTDGILTTLSLHHDYQQIYPPSQQVRILFIFMVTRLILSLIGIFLTIFHYRELSKARLEYADRQRMLHRYNTESISTSNQSSWTRSGGLLTLPRELTNENSTSDLVVPMTLPRAKIATIQRHPLSTLFHSRHPHQIEGESTVPCQQPF